MPFLSRKEKNKNKNKQTLRPLNPLRFDHVSWTLWWLVTTQSTFLEIFRCSRFSQLDSNIIENSLFQVLTIVFS